MKEYEKILKKYPKRGELRYQIIDNNAIILCCSYYGRKYEVGSTLDFIECAKTLGYKMREMLGLSKYVFTMSGYEKEVCGKPIELNLAVDSKKTAILAYKLSETKYTCLNPNYLKKVFSDGDRLFTAFKGSADVMCENVSISNVYILDTNNQIKAVICPVKVNNILKEIYKVTK